MRRFATIAFALASLTSPLAAQSHPDFSGKWALDTKASEGPMMPSAMTVVIAQDTKTLKVDNTATVSMGDHSMEQKSTMVYNLDGTEAKNRLANPQASLDLVSTASWTGSTLVVTTKGDLGPGRAMTQTDHWTLSADGKTLKLARDVVVGPQAIAIKMLFNKQ